MPRNEFALLHPRLSRFVRGSFPGLGPEDVEDVCQHAWETLYRHRDAEGRSVPNAFPFLCQASRWNALGVLRAGRRCRPVPDLPEREGPADSRPEALVDRLFSERYLEALLEQMDAKDVELTRLVISGAPRATIEETVGASGSGLDEMWDRTCGKILDRALAQKGSGLRLAVLKANGEDRLRPDLRVALDRAAASDPGLLLELADLL